MRVVAYRAPAQLPSAPELLRLEDGTLAGWGSADGEWVDLREPVEVAPSQWIEVSETGARAVDRGQAAMALVARAASGGIQARILSAVGAAFLAGSSLEDIAGKVNAAREPDESFEAAYLKLRSRRG